MNPLISPHYISQEIPDWVDTLGRAETLIDIPMFLVGGPASDDSLSLAAGQSAKALLVTGIFWASAISLGFFGLVWWERRGA